MLWNTNCRRSCTMGAVAGLLFLAAGGYIYCAYYQLWFWQNLCGAFAVMSSAFYFWLIPPPQMSTVDILDRGKLDELRMLHEIEFQSILFHYRYITPYLIMELGAAIDELRAAEVSRIARRLGSSSAQIGAVQFSALVHGIQRCAEEGDLRAIPGLFMATLKTYPRVDAALQAVGART